MLRAAGLPDATDAVQEALVQAVVHWRKVSTYDDRAADNLNLPRVRGRVSQPAGSTIVCNSV